MNDHFKKKKKVLLKMCSRKDQKAFNHSWSLKSVLLCEVRIWVFISIVLQLCKAKFTLIISFNFVLCCKTVSDSVSGNYGFVESVVCYWGVQDQQHSWMWFVRNLSNNVREKYNTHVLNNC